jgi:hypothetical protein
VELETIGSTHFILPLATNEEIQKLPWLIPVFATKKAASKAILLSIGAREADDQELRNHCSRLRISGGEQCQQRNAISVPNSTTCLAGTPKKVAEPLALCCRNAKRVSRPGLGNDKEGRNVALMQRNREEDSDGRQADRSRKGGVYLSAANQAIAASGAFR